MKNFTASFPPSFFLAIFLATAMITGCDSPRTRRTILTSSKSGMVGNGMDFTNRIDTGNTIDPTPAPTSTTNPNPEVPEDAKKDCKFSSDGVNGFESSSAHIGAYTLCPSTVDKNVFYFQLKTPPVASGGDVSICFIPNTTSGSNSIYVGNPMCGTFSNPKSVTKITFVKYTQYTNALINTIIFFKDTSYYYPVFNRNMMTLDAYKTCMNMLSYNQPAYCEAFKSVGQYVLRNF